MQSVAGMQSSASTLKFNPLPQRRSNRTSGLQKASLAVSSAVRRRMTRR